MLRLSPALLVVAALAAGCSELPAQPLAMREAALLQGDPTGVSIAVASRIDPPLEQHPPTVERSPRASRTPGVRLAAVTEVYPELESVVAPERLVEPSSLEPSSLEPSSLEPSVSEPRALASVAPPHAPPHAPTHARHARHRHPPPPAAWSDAPVPDHTISRAALGVGAAGLGAATLSLVFLVDEPSTATTAAFGSLLGLGLATMAAGGIVAVIDSGEDGATTAVAVHPGAVSVGGTF